MWTEPLCVSADVMVNFCVWQEQAEEGVMVRAGLLDRQHLSKCFCGCVPLLGCRHGAGKVKGWDT